MTINHLAASACMVLALTACGNSGTSSVPPSRPNTTSTAAPSSGGSAASAQHSTMTISIAIPSKTKPSSSARGPQTISPTTAYLDVVLQSLNGTAQPTDGPYNTLVPVSQLGGCSTGGRAHGRATRSGASCYTATIAAPVGDAVYAIAALDATMTMLDYTENVAVTVTSSAGATLSAYLNGVGASAIGFSVVTDPNHTSSNVLDLVDCYSFIAQYDPQAICGYDFEFADYGGDNMALETPSGYLANAVALTATDLTTHQALNINFNNAPDPANPVHEIDFDPAVPASGTPVGMVLNGGMLTTYATNVRPDLSEIPAGATDTVEFKAVLAPPATTAFGPNVLLPHTGPATFTWDLACKNVTVGPNDPSNVQEGTVMQFCDAPSNVNLVVH